MNLNTIKRKIKKELKSNAHRRKWCKKHYADWVDDEFNMLECHFMWGLSYNDNQTPSFHTLNKAQVYYNRVTQRYYLDIDAPALIDGEGAARSEIARLEEIKSAFRNFLTKNNLRTMSKIPYFYGDDFQFSLTARSPTELYTKFCCMLEGYKWYRESCTLFSEGKNKQES